METRHCHLAMIIDQRLILHVTVLNTDVHSVLQHDPPLLETGIATGRNVLVSRVCQELCAGILLTGFDAGI